MYKFKMYSGKSIETMKTMYKNAKKQAVDNPIQAAALGIVTLNAANGLYNTETSRKARKATLDAGEYIVTGGNIKDRRKRR